MAEERWGKLRLDRHLRHLQPSRMRFTVYFIFNLVSVADATSQAPTAATLWDVAATTLAEPAALETGATGAFWNPAAAFAPKGLRAGAQAVQTPEDMGLSAVLAGLTYPLSRRLSIGLVFGRVQMG